MNSSKRTSKSIAIFFTYMRMAERFGLSEKNRAILIDILNEPALDDFDIIEICEQSTRLIDLFQGVDQETYNYALIEERNLAIRAEVLRSN